MSGGFSSYTSSSSLPERLDLIKRALKKINADFVSLIDTFRWDKIFTRHDLQKIFNYKNAYCVNLEDERLKKLGHNNGITVLTNLPVKKFQTINLSNRDAIKTEIIFKNQPLDIFSLYLDDLSEETRVKQVRSLFKYFNSDRQTILMGDFNSLSQEDATKIKYIGQFFSILEKMKHSQVIPLIRKAGFIDAGEMGGATIPTKMAIKVPFLRLDYIFYTPKLEMVNFHVFKNPFFDLVSDHYPIGANICP